MNAFFWKSQPAEIVIRGKPPAQIKRDAQRKNREEHLCKTQSGYERQRISKAQI